MSYGLYFTSTITNKTMFVGYYNTVEEIYKKIQSEYIVPYIRNWESNGYTMIDYGSHTSYFKYKETNI